MLSQAYRFSIPKNKLTPSNMFPLVNIYTNLAFYNATQRQCFLPHVHAQNIDYSMYQVQNIETTDFYQLRMRNIGDYHEFIQEFRDVKETKATYPICFDIQTDTDELYGYLKVIQNIEVKNPNTIYL